jgi:hypothetical protein
MDQTPVINLRGLLRKLDVTGYRMAMDFNRSADKRIKRDPADIHFN